MSPQGLQKILSLAASSPGGSVTTSKKKYYPAKSYKKKKFGEDKIRDGSSTGVTYSNFGKYKKLPTHLKDFPRQLNYVTDASALPWSNGKQDFAVPRFILNSTQLEQWYQNFADASLSANNNNQFQLYIEKVSGRFTFKNHSNTQAKVTLYECVVKRSTSLHPINCIKDGIGARFNELASTKYKDLIGISPNMSSMFNNHYKILTAKTITMDPGSCHEHKFTYMYHKNFAVSDYFEELNNAKVPYIQGWTRFLMIRCQGTPDTSSTGSPGSSSGKVIWTMDEKINYLMVNTLKQKAAFIGPGIPILADERTIVEDTDAVATVVTA